MSKVSRLPIPAILAVAAACVLAVSVPGPVRADSWWAEAGWIHSDTGLVREGDGLWAGVEGRRPLGSSPLDIGYSLTYAQRVGSVNLVFSHPIAGFLVGPAKVTLHTLEAALTPGIGVDAGPARVRVFGGAALDLKLAESWDTPIGSPDKNYSYEDTDLALVAGADVSYGSWMVGFRYDEGTRDQLLLQPAPGSGKSAAAAEPVGDDPLPAAGNRVSSWRLGLAYRFSGP